MIASLIVIQIQFSSPIPDAVAAPMGSITVLIISVGADCVCLRAGYRTVDALLQRMFEADLDPEDFAESDDPDAQTNGNFANPTFSSA